VVTVTDSFGHVLGFLDRRHNKTKIKLLGLSPRATRDTNPVILRVVHHRQGPLDSGFTWCCVAYVPRKIKTAGSSET
jgi:hypothetical protein